MNGAIEATPNTYEQRTALNDEVAFMKIHDPVSMLLRWCTGGEPCTLPARPGVWPAPHAVAVRLNRSVLPPPLRENAKNFGFR